ncbi:MAG TPA: ABC transporter permease [Candidatus Mediterraneibacter cottocaccae]|nr:ABC transporter permease [Candidatus Mediterraneibacter cottocaccae]
MTVFKAYMKITKKNIWLIVMYLAIFYGLTIMFQQFTATDGLSDYRAESVPVGIVDRDGGAAAEGLIDYLGRSNRIVLVEDDTESLQEHLFYRDVEYIVRIPENFMERCILGSETLDVTAVPDTYAGYYIGQQISSYINFASVYAAAGFTEKEIAKAMETREEAEVVLHDFSGNGGDAPGYTYYFRYLPFLLLSVICYVLGYILLAFHRGKLRDRMRASAVSAHRQNLEGMAAAGVISLALWAVCILTSALIYGKSFLESPGLYYYLLNSFALLVVSLAVAWLIGMVVKDSNALSGIVNVVGLGMCFLCGVFVEQDLLGSAVRRAAQFFPVYWYEYVNNLLTESGKVLENVRAEIFRGIGIQFLFAAALVCVTMVIVKRKAV